jgi:hypothetical protein
MHTIRWTLAFPAAFLTIWMASTSISRADPIDDPQTANRDMPPAAVVVPEGPSSYTTGTVVSSSKEELVVRAPDGHTMDFALDQHRGYGAAMIPGDRVRVEYGALDQDTDVAKNVETLGLLAVLDDGSRESFAAGAPTESSEGSATSRAGATTDVAESSDQLPATASPLPYMFVAGVFLFGSGLVIRLANRGS